MASAQRLDFVMRGLAKIHIDVHYEIAFSKQFLASESHRHNLGDVMKLEQVYIYILVCLFGCARVGVV